MLIYEREGGVKPVHRPKRMRSEDNMLLGTHRGGSTRDLLGDVAAVVPPTVAVILVDEGYPDREQNELIHTVLYCTLLLHCTLLLCVD